jgi:hypothetical protein
MIKNLKKITIWKIYFFIRGHFFRHIRRILIEFRFYKNYKLKKSKFEDIFFTFKEKNTTYKEIQLKLNHKKYFYEINPDKHLKIVKKIKISQNLHYFLNLHNYSICGLIFDKIYDESIKSKYFLNPVNIVFLEVISRINFIKKFNYFVVDIGTGLGNFLGYLNSYIPKENLIGVDNFSQNISGKYFNISEKDLWI